MRKPFLGLNATQPDRTVTSRETIHVFASLSQLLAVVVLIQHCLTQRSHENMGGLLHKCDFATQGLTVKLSTWVVSGRYNYMTTTIM